MSAAAEPSAVRVDIGMVTWNTKTLTLDALRHVVEDVRNLDARILVRDNGSTDGTAAAIAEAFPAIDVDAGHENLGFAAGVNTLLARSDAPWFLLLNSDAWPEPGAVQALVRAATRADASVAIVAPKVVHPAGHPEESTYRFPSLRLALVQLTGAYRIGGLGDRFLVPGYWRGEQARDVDWANGAAWMIRRAAVDDVGRLDERYVMYVEDLEWCWRAAQRGWRVRYDPSAVVVHVGNASGAQRFGAERTATWLHNTFAFYRGTHGALPAAVFRALNVAIAVRLWAAARLRRDHAAAARWAAHARGSVRWSTPDGAMRRP